MWNWNADKTATCFAACATSEDFIKHNVFDGLVKLRESVRKLADMFEAL